MDTLKHNKAAIDAFEIFRDGRAYQVQVCLPATYARNAQPYPVLYVLDGNMLFGAASDIARMVSMARALAPEGAEIPFPAPPEMIVVGIGYPAADTHSIIAEMSTRRMYDLTQKAEGLGREGERIRAPMLQMHPEGLPYGGAGNFLDLLTGAVRSEIQRRYRVDPRQSVLFGASAAGSFAAYALLEAPASFSHYIIASPCLYLCGDDIFDREEAFAAANQDMAANVFLSFGAREVDLFAHASIASATTLFAERLKRRAYPGLRLHMAIFHDETHARACLAAIGRGLDTLFGVA